MYEKIIDVIPFELSQKCISLICKTHKKIGFRELPNLLGQKRNMVTLALIKETYLSIETIKGINKIQKGIWVITLIALIVPLIINLWLLIIPIFLFIILKRFSVTEKKHWSLLASVILGLEILSIDFLHWGSTYPEFMKRSKDLLKYNDGNPTQFLDYYLPNRDSIDEALLNNLSPTIT